MVHRPRSTVHGLARCAESGHGLAIEPDDYPIAGLHDRTPDQPGLLDHQLDHLIVGEIARLESFLPRGRTLPGEEIGDWPITGQPPQLVRGKRLLEDVPSRDGNVRLRESLPRLSAARSIGAPIEGDRIGHTDLQGVKWG